MKKIAFLLFVLVASLVLSSLNFASAAVVSSYGYDNGAADSNHLKLMYLYPNTGASGTSAVLMGFSLAADTYITEFSTWFFKSGSPTGKVMCSLVISIGGVITYLENSTELSMSSFGVQWGVADWDFSGNTQFKASNSSYCVLLTVTDATGCGESAYLNTIMDSTSPTGINTIQLIPTTGWFATGWHMSYYLYGEPNAASTPTPSPSPTVAPTILPVVDTSVPSYYMIILVLFAVVAVLAGIYVGFERDGGNKGVAFLFALVALVIFVVLIVGYLVG